MSPNTCYPCLRSVHPLPSREGETYEAPSPLGGEGQVENPARGGGEVANRIDNKERTTDFDLSRKPTLTLLSRGGKHISPLSPHQLSH